jgi:gliding motility-associated-like protein
MIRSTDTTLAVLFKAAGDFRIAATLLSGCGIITDSIHVNVPRVISRNFLGADTSICTGTKISLNAHAGFSSYQWQNGTTDSMFTVTEPGLYFVTVQDGCGRSYSDSIIVQPHSIISFKVSPDRSKCDEDTIRFSAPTGFLNYSWSPAYNISSPTGQTVVVNPTVDTTYFIRAEKSLGCFAYDTVKVTVHHAPVIQLGSDLSFCQGESRTLDAGAGFNTYHWSTGETSRRITVNNHGQYIINGTTDKGCKASDTLSVINTWPLPVVSLNKTPTLCIGATRTLNPGNFSSYQWHDGSTGSTYVISAPGRYFVTVSDVHGCSGSDTTIVTTLLPQPTGFLPPDTAICTYSKLQVKSSESYATYLWSTGGRANTITIESPALYWLQVEDENRCIGRDSILVSSKACVTGVYIPTAFSPKKDGKNDLFRALVFGRVKRFELTVYNRWGQVIFYTPDHEKGWDGNVAGQEQETGVFVWLCRYQLERGKELVEKGTVTLVR